MNRIETPPDIIEKRQQRMREYADAVLLRLKDPWQHEVHDLILYAVLNRQMGVRMDDIDRRIERALAREIPWPVRIPEEKK